MHIFFYEKTGNISETSKPQAFTIYGSPKNKDINHPNMMAIGSLYYLMPGDDQQTVSFAKVAEGMTQASKHLRFLHIYAGFDPEFSKAQRISRREAEIQVPHPPSNPNDDYIPWVDEVDQHAQTGQGSETHGDFNDDASDFDLNDREELDTHTTKFTNLTAIYTQPVTITHNATWTEEACQTATYNTMINGIGAIKIWRGPDQASRR